MIERKYVLRLLVCAVCLSFRFVPGHAVAASPPYEIVLRSRSSVVTPERTKDAQTGGGFIQVIQVEPNLVLVRMRGSVAAGAGLAGSGHKDGSATMQFDLSQDFEIVPTKAGLRPPRLLLSAWVIGSLVSTQIDEGGTANQGPACASILSGGQPLLNVCAKPHGVTGRQNMLVNDRVGPIEATLAAGGYCLRQSLTLSAFQPKLLCHSGAAAADFDPDPRLDSRWNDVLKPFRAAQHQDYGFRIILQVAEEPLPSGVIIPDTLHRPTPEDKKKTPTPGKPTTP